MNKIEIKLPKKNVSELVLDLRLTYALGIFTFLFVLVFCFDVRVLISIILIYIVAKMIAVLEDKVEEEEFWHIRDLPIILVCIKQVYQLCKFKVLKMIQNSAKK